VGFWFLVLGFGFLVFGFWVCFVFCEGAGVASERASVKRNRRRTDVCIGYWGVRHVRTAGGKNKERRRKNKQSSTKNTEADLPRRANTSRGGNNNIGKRKKRQGSALSR
jgi:hypothetical protein